MRNVRITGWWHAEPDQDHFDYWLRHRIPHILVLHDEDPGVSYWVHITDDAVESTGKGVKILVPSSQTIDEASRDALLDVAMATGSALTTWEGSAWTRPNLLPRDRIRHALIAPRLVAPHPNASPGAVTGIEALAAQVLQRHEVHRLLSAASPSEPELDRNTGWKGPNLAEASTSTDWSWRATAALAQWLDTGDIDPIRALATAAAPAEQAAAAVMHVVARFEAGQVDEALPIIEAVLADDAADPANHAWMQAIHARILFETGRPEESLTAAFEVLTTRTPDADVTVAALASAATHLISQAAGIDTESARPEPAADSDDTEEKRPSIGLGDVIGAADTTVNWWRSQTVAWALPSELDDAFRTWADDTSIRFQSDGAANRIRAAALISSFAADDPSARSARKMLAQHHLLRLDPHANPAAATGLLVRLARSGDHGDTALATRKIVKDGPASAAREAAHLIDPARSIHSTASAELELLTAAGDVLHPDQANTICNWAMQTLNNPREYAKRIRPTFLVRHKLLRLLAAAVPATSIDLQQSVIEHVLQHYAAITADSHGMMDMDCAAVLEKVADAAWAPAFLARAAELARNGTEHTARTLQRRAANHDPDVRIQVFAEVEAGSVGALRGVDDVRLLPPKAVDAAIRLLNQQVAEQRAQAQRGVHSIGFHDPLHSLALLNRWHPPRADWGEVHQALIDPRMRSDQLAGVLRSLASQYDGYLEESDRVRLIEAIRPLASRPPRHRFIDREDTRGVALEALSSLGDDVDLAAALTSGTELRRSAAAIIGFRDHPGDVELILALANDHDTGVQAAAAGALGRYATSSPSNPAGVDAATALIERSGTTIAQHIASTVKLDGAPAEAAPLLDRLINHESAAVRGLMTRDRAST